MGLSVDDRLGQIQRRNAVCAGESAGARRRAGVEIAEWQGESLHMEAVLADQKRRFGRAIARGMHHGQLTPKALATLLQYSDPTAVYRWHAGTEPAPLPRLCAIPAFVGGFIISLGETYAVPDRIQPKHIVEVRFP